MVSRIDRDIRPLFLATASLRGGGRRRAAESARAATGWSGNHLGDFWVGAKVNLTSQWRQQPAAFAMRGMVKLPTGDKDSGAGTGKADFALDAIVSKEINQRVEVSGYGGFIVRGAPDEVEHDQRVPLGRRRGLPVAQVAAVHRGADGEAYTNSTLATQDAAARRRTGRSLPVGFTSDDAVAGRREPRADVAGARTGSSRARAGHGA